jgi:hypothetical protein
MVVVVGHPVTSLPRNAEQEQGSGSAIVVDSGGRVIVGAINDLVRLSDSRCQHVEEEANLPQVDSYLVHIHYSLL